MAGSDENRSTVRWVLELLPGGAIVTAIGITAAGDNIQLQLPSELAPGLAAALERLIELHPDAFPNTTIAREAISAIKAH